MTQQATTIPKNVVWGVYVWRNADGTALSNSNGEVLSLDGFRGDLAAMNAMREAAAYYGSADGQPAFIPGSGQVSQSEWEDQMEAFIDGRPIPGDIDG